MATKKAKQDLDINTEAKIKNAARVMFHKKGFAATRTRDIAEEAGINLALLNYYFRSKEKLFDIIMMETMQGFFQAIAGVLNDEDSSLEKKVEMIVSNYIDLMIKEPEIPLFIMNAVSSNADDFFNKIPIGKMLLNSAFVKQYQKAVLKGKISEPNPFHFMLNLMGLTIFPFAASPMFKKLGNFSNAQFEAMMHERKLLIPKWIKAIMKAK